MTIGVLKEPGFETRVSLIAETIAPLIKKGVQVLVESDAGASAGAAMLTMKKLEPRSLHPVKSFLNRISYFAFTA